MLLPDVFCDYILYIKHELGFSARTVEMYQSRGRHCLNWMIVNGYPAPAIKDFNAPVLRRYLYAESERGLRPRTIRGLFHPITGLGDFLVKQKLIEDNPARTIAMPKLDAADRTLATDQDLNKLMSGVELQADPQKVAFERAVLSVLINCGPRAQELLDMKTGHFSADAKTLLVAHGKGEKSRLLHPPLDTTGAVDEWLVYRTQMGCRHDHLWAITVTRRLGYEGLRAMLEEAKARAGLAGNDQIKCHSMRRAFATRMMQRGGSIKAIQASLGHSMPETTFKYLFLAEQDARVMADIGALTATPLTPAPAKAAPDSPSHAREIVKTFDKAAFHSSRRRTPAK